jgi:hypothetical protein
VAIQQEASASASASAIASAESIGTATPTWLFSWPLLSALCAYVYSLYHQNELLMDGDTYWHIATGKWIMANGAVPATDAYSHTMRGAVWTAHEWLSEVILAAAHLVGSWPLVVVVTAVAFSLTMALLMRALLRWFEPIYAILFTGLAFPMTSGHLLARPHILAMPILMIWTIELVRATEGKRMPSWWLLPVMTLWANLHGGFTLGLALACAFAVEAVIHCPFERRVAVAKHWALFVGLAILCSLVTPQGVQGILFTWQVMAGSSYALQWIGEWMSPEFQTFSVFELWILGGFALVLHQGLRLPPIRLALMLGLLHLALKHVRNVELVGLLAPLIFADAISAQWRQSRQSKGQLQVVDRFFETLAKPASASAMLAAFVVAVAGTMWNARARAVELPESVVPARAIEAVQKAGIAGRVLNSYSTGGYLIYAGIPVFIDGRADLYGDEFIRRYVEALELRTPKALENLLDKYDIGWTLLQPNESANSLMDHLPGWRRFYEDKSALVYVNYVKAKPSDPPASVNVPANASRSIQ